MGSTSHFKEQEAINGETLFKLRNFDPNLFVYAASFREMVREGKDPLVRYRASEMARLLQEKGRIRAFDYELSVKALDQEESRSMGSNIAWGKCKDFSAGKIQMQLAHTA